MRHPKIGLFLGMHDEVQQALQCIESFRRTFRSNDIMLLGNLLPEVQAVGTKSNLPFYVGVDYVDRLINLRNRTDVPSKEELFGIVFDHLLILKDRITKFDVDVVLPVHPDHFILRDFSETFEYCHMEIDSKNKLPGDLIRKLDQTYHTSISISSYGLIGFVWRSALLDVLEYLLQNRGKRLKELIGLDDIFVYDDVLIPVTARILGLKVQHLGITKELGRSNKNLYACRNARLLHQVPKGFILYKRVFRLIHSVLWRKA